MKKMSLAEIIDEIQQISSKSSTAHPEFAEQINKVACELKKLEEESRTDQVIDRSKKITEVVNLILRLLFDFFNGS